MSNSNSNTLAPIVTIKADRVVASSRDVAAYFGKAHFNVLQDIDGIARRLPEFAALNFQCCSYTDLNNRERRMFEMTRDGFTFLAMGFTGAKADAFKLAYLNEFNRMEEELRKQAQFSIPQDYASALRLAADEHEKRIALEAKVAEDAPKVANWEAFQNTEATITTGHLAKSLGFRSAQALNTFLHDEGVIFPRRDRNFRVKGWEIAAEFAQDGLHQTYWATHNGVATTQLRWTPKGADFIRALVDMAEV